MTIHEARQQGKAEEWFAAWTRRQSVQITGLNAEIKRLRAEIASLRESLALIPTLIDGIEERQEDQEDILRGIKHHCYGALMEHEETAGGG